MSDAEQRIPKQPERLFHYTSIESLALILDSRSFLFRRVDLLDDVLEGRAADIQNVGRFYFVSCWTADAAESIPFWHMYTNGMKGVRIELPSFPFIYYDQVGAPVSHIDVTESGNYLPVDPKRQLRFDVDMVTLFHPSMGFLYPIQYIPLEDLIPPQFVVGYDGGVAVATSSIASKKSDHWRFQKEWRYVINVMPRDFFNYNPAEKKPRTTLVETDRRYANEC